LLEVRGEKGFPKKNTDEPIRLQLSVAIRLVGEADANEAKNYFRERRGGKKKREVTWL